MITNKNILNDANLLKKYDVYAFDYIEYPHKSFWNKNLSQDDIKSRLRKLINDQVSTMLYVHIANNYVRFVFVIDKSQVIKALL